MAYTKVAKPTASYTKAAKPTASYTKTEKTICNDFLLMQDSDFLLLQDGGQIILNISNHGWSITEKPTV